ncbi:phosphoribosylformylglycinamidine cyclo-ligase [Marinicella sp. W31]|uniref:phosphoribosylformylglycinamidine cyclo-ligase n=1 Tax=Marinicella sp. W31 TaxID=3023713 RepID=UPI00375693CD
MNKDSLTYQQAGVDIDAGNALVEKIKPAVAATQRPGVMGTVGGFGGLFDLSTVNCESPVLVSGTDGVGTKLKMAEMMADHSTIGIDLVAMCVNDILTLGAEPLFFLDYYACSQLHPEQATDVIKGIAHGCQQAGCALIGGETAEMPGIYQNNDYDLAGFVVGVVDKKKIIDGSSIAAGDRIIGIESSGPHSNGYSLIRKILEVNNTDLNTPLGDSSIGSLLLEPTLIYAKTIAALVNSNLNIKGLAHITGGGLTENISRIIPQDLGICIDLTSYTLPDIFNWLQQQGNVAESEMLRTFNCGVGMTAVVDAAEADQTIETIRKSGLRAWQLGTVEEATDQPVRFMS